MDNPVIVVGGGPAGAAAAIAARLEGALVRMIERRRSPRHKVCGEFISPGGRYCMESLGVWEEFSALSPCCITRCKLHFGRRTKQWRLPECAWGMSRLQLDSLLLRKAVRLGTEVSWGEVFDGRPQNVATSRLVVASGRNNALRRNALPGTDRLFGFKAHFRGGLDDAVELFFDKYGYVGVSGIEDQLTNVCGIAQESVLRKYRFDFDALVRRSPSIADRLDPLRRTLRWVVVGPICFSPPQRRSLLDRVYPAGDALGFIDPFTGSGILNALLTGRMAGRAAARGVSAHEYLDACASLLTRPFAFSSVLRSLTN